MPAVKCIPVETLDIKRVQRAMNATEPLFIRSQELLAEAKAFKKKIDALDERGERWSADDDLEEVYSSHPSPDSLGGAIDDLIEILSANVKIYETTHDDLEDLESAIDGWDRVLRARWQKLFTDAFGARAKMTKAELDASFLDAAIAAKHEGWLFKGRDIELEIEEIFKHQAVFGEDEKEQEDEEDEPLTLEAIEDQIRAAYLDETGGAAKTRVLLKDLRPKVGVQKADFDQAILEMQKQGKVVLMGLDNPMERTAAVEDAAVSIAGRPRHLVYFQDLR